MYGFFLAQIETDEDYQELKELAAWASWTKFSIHQFIISIIIN